MWLVYLISLFSIFRSADEHAIYISVLEVDIIADTLLVEIKVFEDDLRDALRTFPEETVWNEKLTQYFNKHLSIHTDAVKHTLELTKDYLEGESYRIHLNSSCPGEFKELTIRAAYFFELFPTQQNILKLNYNGEKAYHIFEKASPVNSFNFSD